MSKQQRVLKAKQLLCINDAFWHISLTSTVQLRHETSQSDVSWRMWTYYDNFFLLSIGTWIETLRIQLHAGKVAYISRIEL